MFNCLNRFLTIFGAIELLILWSSFVSPSIPQGAEYYWAFQMKEKDACLGSLVLLTHTTLWNAIDHSDLVED